MHRLGQVLPPRGGIFDDIFSLLYRSVGPNGRAVLHTIANDGGCSDKWGKILQISAKEVDKELKRALKYKFQRDDVPDPLETKYQYWEEGFW